MKLIDIRIAALPPPKGVAVAEPTADQLAATAEAAARVEEQRVEAERLKEQAVKQQKLYDYWSKIVKVKKSDLPDLTKAPEMDPSAAPVLACMYYWRQTSALSDAQLPFTFKEMGATTDVAGDLVGTTVWQASFGRSMPNTSVQ